MCCEAVVYVYVGAEPICCVAKDALRFRCLSSNDGEDGCPYLENAAHEGYGAIIRGVVGAGFVRFIDEFVALVHHFVGV